MKLITKAAITLTLFATVNADAFELRTGVTSSTGKDSGYIYEGETYNSYDSTNVLIEIGDYRKIDQEGFGWGWRLGGSYPLNTDEWYYGTTILDVGLAIGYDIVKDLTIKGEVGAGLDAINEDNLVLAVYLGLGLDYVLAKHYLFGVAARQHEEVTSDHWKESSTFNYSNLKTTLYVGYRF